MGIAPLAYSMPTATKSPTRVAYDRLGWVSIQGVSTRVVLLSTRSKKAGTSQLFSYCHTILHDASPLIASTVSNKPLLRPLYSEVKYSSLELPTVLCPRTTPQFRWLNPINFFDVKHETTVIVAIVCYLVTTIFVPPLCPVKNV